MIRVLARYEVLSDDFAMLDRVTDDLMDNLMVQTTIQEPDVAFSLHDHVLEIWLVVPTDNPVAATATAAEALNIAFAAAGLSPPATEAQYIHKNLLGADTHLKTELVPA